MTRPLRRAHLVIATTMAILLPLAFAIAFFSR